MCVCVIYIYTHVINRSLLNSLEIANNSINLMLMLNGKQLDVHFLYFIFFYSFYNIIFASFQRMSQNKQNHPHVMLLAIYEVKPKLNGMYMGITKPAESIYFLNRIVFNSQTQQLHTQYFFGFSSHFPTFVTKKSLCWWYSIWCRWAYLLAQVDMVVVVVFLNWFQM